MNKASLFIKSIAYSFGLIYRSSGLMPLLYLLLRLLTPTLELLGTFAIKLILDSLIAADIHTKMLLFSVLLYVLSLVITQGLLSAEAILYDTIFKKAEHLYECELAHKLSELSLSVIDSSAGKDMVDDVRYTMYTAVHISNRIVSAITYIYTFAIAFVALARFHVWFSLLFLFLTIPGIVLDQVFMKKAEALRMKTAPDIRRFCYYRWMATDAGPAKDVRMYDLTEPIKMRYNQEKKDYLKANKRLDQQRTRWLLFSELIKQSGVILFTAFAVVSAINGRITVGDLALYVGFVTTASISFENMLDILVNEYTISTECMGRLFEFFNIRADTGNPGARRLSAFESLVFENVYFQYPHTDKYVLNGVSFALNKGDKLSIVGINGSGKSTIIKLMLGLYPIESGQILINGYPMADYDIRDVRKLFSALFQSFVQYPLTLRENIALSSLERMDNSDEIEHVLMQSGVYEDLKPKLENGLDSFMTRQFADEGTELSKGQWQKIALSRAYFKNAPIIIFDEPSAALDAEAEDRIFKNFESMSDGKTGIMISHRISSARMSSMIIVLDGGRITEQGTHDELISLGGLYAKLYNLQREKYIVQEGGNGHE